MALATIGLGSNVGDRQAHINQALVALAALPASHLEAVATIREYAAVGGPKQPPYLNTVCRVSTTLGPRDLLRQLQAVEAQLGRARPDAVRWGPRPMDLDLLLYDTVILNDPDCTVPHPRLHERAFVLEPLVELDPDAYHPVLRMTACALLEHLHSKTP